MATAVERSAFSQVIREMLDYSTAVFDVSGGIVAHSSRQPLHMDSMTRSLRTMLRDCFPLESWRPGDVFVTNDPYSGGQHLPDIQTFAPVFHGDRCVAIVGTLGHHLDVGGRAPASYAADATEIYQEGFRIPPLRIVSQGEPSDVFMPLFAANIRVPDKTCHDVLAQIAALSIGAQDVVRVASRYGNDEFLASVEALLASYEESMRARIRSLPDGRYEAHDTIDGDGLDDEPFEIHVAVERDGDDLIIDFGGTAQQVRGPVNVPLAATESATYFGVTSVLSPGVVPNEGSYRPLRVVAPEGSVLNPRFPAPVVGRNVICHRVATIVMDALGQALPEYACGSYYGNTNVYVVATAEQPRKIQFETEVGGWGGRPSSDGPDCLSAGIHNLNNNPIELVEQEFPIRVTWYGLRPDSGGAGRTRGGLGAIRTFEALEACEFSSQFDRMKFPAPGQHGGSPGAPAAILVERADGRVEQLPGKNLGVRLEPGDKVTILTQGGGGLGSPEDRDEAALLADLKEGKVSEEAAAEQYGFAVKEMA